MRRLIAFPCEGATLIGSLDTGRGLRKRLDEGGAGLLIVSGGNEIRAGAHRGMALLAARLAAGGVPVFRFDRRGVGDSEGTNHGYAASAADLAAAAAAFRAAVPTLRRIVGFGNCDGATALALFGRDVGIDAVVLANPWVVDAGDLPPAAALRRHYAERLSSPRAWLRALTGRIDGARLLRGLFRLTQSEPQELADRAIAAIAGWGEEARIILAQGDATAIAFAAAAAARDLPTAIEHVATDSHSFARAADAAALQAAIRRAL